MVAWFALAIPILVIAVSYWIFHHKIVLWEVLLMLFVPTLAIAIGKWGVESSMVQDTEYWGANGVRAEYYEDWNERVSCRHPKYKTVRRTRTVYRDGKARTETYYVQVQDGYHHLYDVDYHPERWHLIDSLGRTFSIGQGEFEEFCKHWSNRAFKELNRSYHTNDGDMYFTNWDNKIETVEAVSSAHSYENKVQASKSVFNFKEVDPKVWGLYDYPKVHGYRQQSVLGHGGPTHGEGERLLDTYNALLGPTKEVRLFTLIFKNQPIQAGTDQEAYWKGGNKNEFVTCVGVNDAQEVQWCHVFSWSEKEDLKIDARNKVMEQKVLDLAAYAKWLGPEVEKRFVRYNWDKFNYLTVEPSGTALAVIFFVTFLVSVGIAVFAVLNEVNPEGSPTSVKSPSIVVALKEAISRLERNRT